MFAAADHSKHTKRQHAFAGLVTYDRGGCAFTAETKKGQYIYYHCTGHKGPCGNTYVREEELIRQFGEILKGVRIPADRLSDAIPDELWTAKSAELQEELRRVRTEMERHEATSQAYGTAGLQNLELAQTAYSSHVAKNPREQARLVRTLVSNATFDRGTLTPAYIKPFDVFARGRTIVAINGCPR